MNVPNVNPSAEPISGHALIEYYGQNNVLPTVSFSNRYGSISTSTDAINSHNNNNYIVDYYYRNCNIMCETKTEFPSTIPSTGFISKTLSVCI